MDEWDRFVLRGVENAWSGRCVRCGYSVEGLPRDVCPECGFDTAGFRRSDEARRVLRELRWIVLWASLALGIALLIGIKAAQEGAWVVVVFAVPGVAVFGWVAGLGRNPERYMRLSGWARWMLRWWMVCLLVVVLVAVWT